MRAPIPADAPESRRPRTWRCGVFAVSVMLVAAGCAGDGDETPVASSTTTPPTVTEAPSGAPTASTPAAPTTAATTTAPTTTVVATPTAPSPTVPVPATTDVPWSNTGKLVPIPFSAPAPAGVTTVRRLAFQVEEGIDVDPEEFVRFTLATLNDDRGWKTEGYGFAADAANPHTVVVLASPTLSSRMCLPLQTGGVLSCRTGNKVVLTNFRWQKGHHEYGADLLGYRRYLISHEVGHSIGKGHVNCPGAGQLAPTMMQQTKGLLGCRPNPWPYP